MNGMLITNQCRSDDRLRTAVFVRSLCLVIGSIVFLVPLTVLAELGEGVKLGTFTLSPYADGSMVYDSNIDLEEENPEEDYFTDLQLGLRLMNLSDRMALNGSVMYRMRRYREHTEKDHDDYGDVLNFRLGDRKPLALSIYQRYGHLADYEMTSVTTSLFDPDAQGLYLAEDRTERVQRDLFSVGVNVGSDLTDKMKLDAGLGYDQVDYEDEYLYDWYDYSAQAQLSREVTDKTSLLLNGMWGRQHGEGLDDEPRYWAIRGGATYDITHKTLIKAMVGYENYHASSPGQDDDLGKRFLVFDLAASWAATEKLTFQASGRNGMRPAAQYDENTKDYVLFSLGGAYDITETVSCSLAGSYRHDVYMKKEPVDGELKTITENQWAGRLRLTWRPRDSFVHGYVEGTYEDTDNTFEHYDQLRLTLGLSLWY